MSNRPEDFFFGAVSRHSIQYAARSEAARRLHGRGTSVARVIWNQTGHPTRYVSDVLGIERWQLRQAIHKIKARAHLGPTDRIIVYDDGRVTDASDGSDTGNIYDEI